MAIEFISTQYVIMDKVMKKSLISRVAILGAMLAATAVTSNAAQAQDGDQIKDLLACDKIKNSGDKLECFNAVIAILKQQETSKEQTGETTDSDRMRRRSGTAVSPRGSNFGFTDEQVRQRQEKQSGGTSRTPKEQFFTFTHKWRDAAGKFYFLMSNGQIWKELGGSHLKVPKRAKKIRIKKNIMGGYAAYIEGINGRRGNVKRIK